MTTYTLTNPQRPEEWDIYAEFLESDGDSWGVQPTDVCECGHGLYDHKYLGDYDGRCGKCRDCHRHRPILARDLPRHTHAPYRARLTAWLLRMADERWHGVKTGPHIWGDGDGRKCHNCDARCRQQGPLLVPTGECLGEKAAIPTFALLFDHDGKCRECDGEGQVDDPQALNDPDRGVDCPTCHVTGRERIRGHWGELVDWMKEAGDPKAEEVGEVKIIQHGPHGGIASWGVKPCPGERYGVYYSYADACREALRRLREMLTEDCPWR